jgi:hypothetical protein
MCPVSSVTEGKVSDVAAYVKALTMVPGTKTRFVHWLWGNQRKKLKIVIVVGQNSEMIEVKGSTVLKLASDSKMGV